MLWIFLISSKIERAKKKDLQSNFFPAFIRSENCFWIVPFYIQIESSERPFSIWFKFFHIRDFIPESFWFLTYILLGKMMKCLAKKLRQTIEPRFFPKKELVILGLFFFAFVFSTYVVFKTVDSKYILTMAGFEPWISGLWSDPSTNCWTTTAAAQGALCPMINLLGNKTC